MKNTHYFLGFSHIFGIGPVKFSALLQYFGSVRTAYEASSEELAHVIGQNLAGKFVTFRNTFDAEKKIEEISKKNIRIITQEDKQYPGQLKNIPDPPICLYVKGNIQEFNFDEDLFFAVVGTRKPTSYGQQIARKFSSELAESGFVIVSGMAMGIDATAHQAALDKNGKTIAVLGCGVDIVYPAINRNIYDHIVKSGGLVISEFPPGQMVQKGLFIARNRLISGLSIGVLVVEGGKDSGSLITARYAANQGKEVFAPPVPLTSEMSEAPSLLLKQGAKLVTTIDDILEEFHIKKIKKTILPLSDEEQSIVKILQKESLAIDELLEKIDFDMSYTMSLLTGLEIKGIVTKTSSGQYEVIL